MAAGIYFSAGVFPESLTGRKDFMRVFILDDKISSALRKEAGTRTEDDVSRLATWLASKTEAFEAVHTDVVRAICQKLRGVECDEGDVVYSGGEQPPEQEKVDIEKALCVVVAGKAVIHTESHGEVGTCMRGDTFGKLSLMQVDDSEPLRVIAAADPALPKSTLLLAVLSEREYKEITKSFSERMLFRNLVFCGKCRLFESWSKSRLLRLCGVLKSVVFPRGTVILQQGTFAPFMAFLRQGQCEVYRDLEVSRTNRWPTAKGGWAARTCTVTQPFPFAVLGEGDYFGELSIIRPVPAEASVVARTVVELLVLPREQFPLVMRHANTLAVMRDKIRQYDSDTQASTIYAEHVRKTRQLAGGVGGVDLGGRFVLH